MKIYRILYIPTVVVLFTIFPLFLSAESLMPDSDIFLNQIGAAERAVFDENGFVFRYDEEGMGPVYLPESGFYTFVENIQSSLKPEVMVEALYFIEYPSGMTIESEAVRMRMNEITHSVSSISGAMYFSRTEQDYAVLFDDVYAVAGAGSRKKVNDPVPPEIIPDEKSLYLHMNEHSLGRGYYRMDYLSRGSDLAICLTNTTAMSRIIKAVDKEEMKIFLQMIPCTDGLLVYGYCGVVLRNDGIVNMMMDPYYSFYRRMTAMETWLYNSLHKTDKLPPLAEPMP
ncbi:MAG: hypothetical protein PQJ61_00805 [Spirochaetales bacterium]|uniref:Uncharacterized protein n=1 Tax=Candidatus Thalassospirochaeta sargassi TaxID=3119039 RepID=A0AAJ1I9S1_9SPIO|nr:hypothetical protein [Spirochaetales bacterium]